MQTGPLRCMHCAILHIGSTMIIVKKFIGSVYLVQWIIIEKLEYIHLPWNSNFLWRYTPVAPIVIIQTSAIATEIEFGPIHSLKFLYWQRAERLNLFGSADYIGSDCAVSRSQTPSILSLEFNLCDVETMSCLSVTAKTSNVADVPTLTCKVDVYKVGL